MELGTGASVSLMPLFIYKQLGWMIAIKSDSWMIGWMISKPKATLQSVTGQIVQVYGESQVNVRHQQQSFKDLTLFIVGAIT